MSLRLAVALDRHGWHPAAPGDAAAAFTAAHWSGPVRAADAAGLDFVTVEDTFGPPETGPARPDAVLVAARLAPLTRHVGLVPVATTTHTEPFHLSTALATLDYLTGGRAGWQVRVSGRPEEAALLGRRAPLPASELLAEAADAVEVVRRLWDSWQDDAVIRDVATGRYLDRDRVHYVDFAGRYFSVKGPSIVPRPPQGQPVVTALAHTPSVYEFAARTADVVFVTPAEGTVAEVVGAVRAAEAAAGRTGSPLRIFADLVVSDRPDLGPLDSDATVVIGPPEELADLLERWRGRGIEGFRLRPAALPGDLEAITRRLVPMLRARGLFAPRAGRLRDRLGLPPARNRYAEGAVVA
ncbi:LLM class flavin-dependent oxidoreductase [Jidongwangia harbinensis]|uniref:LLM class flavin-dependent oxidoreductase n=1 Tax=Jidongwangia harbinensis TaxID=2878561 RepID=UPI001CD9452B|nr:LLM class flavin-dependent oxidoreductase [Jidongwangia harbinensis]MCA2217608.1 LLM class flavin-dependent oxidoreductase [Jidongwangia harbinensis]